jgi:hypothetical protein
MQMIIGKLDVPKRREKPRLICIEPAQLPFEGILVARGLSRSISSTQQPSQPRALAALSESDRPQKCDSAQAFAHVLIVNFSHEEIEVPKATVLGMAEKISESPVAALNDEPTGELNKGSRHTKVVPSFREYLNDKLGHLSREEREAIEPVLLRYRNIFHVQVTNDFKGTDLIEHRIITGNAKPIRKKTYRVPYALREEMNTQVKDMLKKGIIETSSSPWLSPAILVPKTSQDGKPKYRFCVDFRALNGMNEFDANPLHIFDETMSTVR